MRIRIPSLQRAILRAGPSTCVPSIRHLDPLPTGGAGYGIGGIGRCVEPGLGMARWGFALQFSPMLFICLVWNRFKVLGFMVGFGLREGEV